MRDEKRDQVYQCAVKLVKRLVKRVYALYDEEHTDRLVSVVESLEKCEEDEYEYTKLSVSVPMNDKFELYIKMKKKEGISFFFFSFMFECLEKRLGAVTQDGIEEDYMEKWESDIYHETVEKFRQYLVDYFCIDLEDINMVSATYYEGEPAKGKISFAGSGTLKAFIELNDRKDGVTLGRENARKIRKLIEITNTKSDENDILRDAVFVFQKGWKHIGFGSSEVEKYRITYEFIGHMSWRMYFEQKLVISYQNGTFLLPYEQDKEDLCYMIEEKMRVPDADMETIWSLIQYVTKQEHGTILIVVLEDEKAVRDEVKNIIEKSSGTAIQAKCLDQFWALGLTAVDGALIANKIGQVYGYGMILNGEPEKPIKKDSGRGARYHAAKKYIAQKSEEKIKAFAVIKSEDGMIDYFSTVNAEEEKKRD